MRVNILRQQSPFSSPYWESFNYDGPYDATVASMLDYLNYKDDIENADGESVPRISWECSCLQGMCGGCAMVINDGPALACETFINNLGDEISIRPLSKFPVISDLVVDRGIIQENLLTTNSFIGKFQSSDMKEYQHQYEASKCLKCGLCLEVCPNYSKGEKFFGALFANDAYLIATRSGEFQTAIKEEYDKHFAAGCSKALSCMDVCPMKIPTISSMAKLNRG